MFSETFNQAKNLIQHAGKILIASHAHPDPDAIGATLAVKRIAENLNREAALYNIDGVPDYLKFLPGVAAIKETVDYDGVDLIIGVDYGSFNRLGLDEEKIAGIPFLTFDHHTASDQRGFLIIDENISSTCEILYHFLNYLEIKVDKDLATCLLAGIYEDTGGFRHSNTGETTLKIAGELLLKGAPLNKIVKYVDQNDLPNVLKFWAMGLNRTYFDEQAGVVFSFIPYSNFSDSSKEIANFSGLPHLLSTVPEAKMSALMIEKEPGVIKVSLRSQQERGVDVARGASFFGGRGLRLSAGFTSQETPEAIMEKIRSIIYNESVAVLS